MKPLLSTLPALLAMSALGACAPESAGSVNVGDADIHYESTGRGQPVVLLHGWAQDLTIWDAQVAALAPGYRVIRIDLRGFGESGGFADETAEADDLRVVLDSLGISTAHVLGLSRGARAALDFAVNFPDRVSALVLYGMPPPEGFQPMPLGPGPLGDLGELARSHGLDSVGKAVIASPLAWMPPDRPDLQAALREGWARYKGRDLLDPRPPSGRLPLARVDQVDGIRVPTLIVHGDHELPLMQQVADTLVRRIPGARKIVIAEGGHGAHFAQPEQFNRAILGFFGGVGGRR